MSIGELLMIGLLVYGAIGIVLEVRHERRERERRGFEVLPP